MIVVDTGPIVSAVNRAEGRRHTMAAALLGRLGRDAIVPWPVFTEVDLLLRARRSPRAAVALEHAVASGVHRLEAPTDAELELAIDLGDRYADSGADLPDLVVMAIAATRSLPILTWDFRHFRSVVLERGHHWDLVVTEADVPDS